MIEIELTKELLMISTMAFTITEAFKIAGVNGKYAPLISIIMGVALGIIAGINPFLGLIAGLSASGLYSGVKASSKGKEINLIPHID